MTYDQILSTIYALGRFGIRPGLERVSNLLAAMGNPQERLKVIHVAGTNGKGSTSSFLASILSESGYRTGLFTSPHLISFTERMKVDGKEITPDEVTELAQQVLSVAAEGTTYFEVVTAMACCWFAEKGVDVAVLEAGMGGRFDATNAAPGILSVITPISFDHCDWLGDTLTKIASDKAGIIGTGRGVVCATQPVEALEVIRQEADSLGARLYLYGRNFSASWREGKLDYRGLNVELEGISPGNKGSYQKMNAAVALAAAEALAAEGLPVRVEALSAGIEKASWPGRMELFPGPPRILLDGAHNPAGGEALAEALADVPRRRLLAVVGILEGKDMEGILSPLVSLIDRMFCVTPRLDRALSSAKLAKWCSNRGMDAVDCGAVAEGLEAACSEAAPEDLVLVCGSLFTIGEVRALLLSKKFEPFRG